jgi:hypothetical protein
VDHRWFKRSARKKRENNNNNIIIIIIIIITIIEIIIIIIIIELQRMWNVKARVIPVIIGATGTISKSFRK